MRILAVALFASVLVAVSLAAPTASEERYATSVEGNDETPSNITIDYVALFTCSNEVIKNTTAEYNLTEVWETFEPAFLDHLANLTACPSVGDEDAVQVCQQTVLQAANTTYRTFFNVVKELNQEAADAIYQRYYATCRQTSPPVDPTEEPAAADSYELNGEVSLFGATSFDYVALLTCAIGAGGDVTQEFELDTVWGEYEPKLVAHLNNLLECANAEDENAVQTCFATEVPVANATFFEFLGAVGEQSEEAAAKIVELIQTLCYNAPTEVPPTESTEATTTVPSLSYESNEEAPLNGTVDYVGILACTIEVGKNVTQEYELVVIWEAYEPQLLAHLANFTSCPSAGDADAVEACYNNEVQASNETLRDFLATVRNANQEAADKIVLLYHNVCRASPSTQPTEAPETTTLPAVSFELNEETLSNQTIDYVALFTCSNEISKNTTAEYNLTEVWETFEPAILEHLTNLTACLSLGDEDAVQVCQQTVLQAANTTYRTFFNVVKELNPEAADAILIRYHTICRETSSSVDPTEEPTDAVATFELDEELPPVNGSAANLLQCAIDVGRHAAVAYELNEIWEKFETRLEEHLENINNCIAAGDEEAIEACYVRERQAAKATYLEFVAVVREQNEEAAQTIIEYIRSSCLNSAQPTEEPSTEPTTVPADSNESF